MNAIQNSANSKTESVGYLLERLARFVNNNRNKKTIGIIRRILLYNDEPKIFAYSAEYKTKHRQNESIASGLSFNKKKALIRVLGEGIERYCLEWYVKKPLIIESSERLQTYHLDPTQIISFSYKQLKKNSFRKFRVNKKSKLGWITGFSLTREQNILVPYQLAGIHSQVKNESIIRIPISTGAAAGASLSSALYRGICEIIERDAFLISYLNKLYSPHIDLASLKDKTIHEIIDIFSRYKLELIVINLTTDLQIPAFAALTLDSTGKGPAVSVGLKAGFNIKESIIGAIEESLMTRSWIRDKFTYKNPHSRYKKKKIIRNFEDRAYFWFTPKTIKYIDFWLKNKNFKKIKANKLNISGNKLDVLLKLLKKKNMEVIYVDITHPKVKDSGFTVVKVIIPQLHPLYLDEQYPYLGGNRLYQTPVELGFSKKSKTEDQLNKIPHPFL